MNDFEQRQRILNCKKKQLELGINDEITWERKEKKSSLFISVKVLCVKLCVCVSLAQMLVQA
ncbi:hypothetical protein DERP_004958 [Dermatophagoides pteronyssinus]|uniref:Uncharacterized protein n=1 Tax=Dermatophagoides pteronyssinus TaxID=6956 RepID=A0ABQ8JTJ5_DERPT|nr:hypothetical protein DERP_004958 [Dermatophagoides pteronyssinus]